MVDRMLIRQYDNDRNFIMSLSKAFDIKIITVDFYSSPRKKISSVFLKTKSRVLGLGPSFIGLKCCLPIPEDDVKCNSTFECPIFQYLVVSWRYAEFIRRVRTKGELRLKARRKRKGLSG